MAISQADIDLNNRLMGLVNTLGQGNASLQQALREQTRNMIGAQKDVIEEYEAHLNQAKNWSTKEAQDAKARLLRLKGIENQRMSFIHSQTQKMRALATTQRKLTQDQALAQAQYTQITQNASATATQVAASLNRLTNVTNALNKAQQDEVKLRTETAAGIAVIRGAARERRNLEASELSLTRRFGQQFRSTLHDTIIGGAQKVFSGVSISAAIGKAAENTFNAVSTEMKTGGYNVSMNPADVYNTHIMARMGLNQQEAAQASADFRRTVMSTSRGMNEFVEGMKQTESKFFDIIADPKERTAMAMKKMEMSTAAGIRFRAEDAASYRDEMQRTAKLTGMTATDFTASINEIVKDEDIQQKLKAATNEQERRAIVDGIAQQFAQNKAMGMTTQQAMGAAKALGKIAGEGPLERFKKAAKIRAMGAAMGMGGEANRAADIIQLGQRATAEQQAELKATLGKMSESVTQTATGSISAEIFADTLANKLDLKGLIGAQSAFNVTLSTAVAPLESAAKSLTETNALLKGTVSAIATGKAAVFNNDIANIGMAAVGGWLLPKLTGWVPKILGMGGAGAGAGAAGAGAGVLGGITAAGLVSTVGAIVGSTALLETAYKTIKGDDDISNYVSRFTTNNVGNMFEGIASLGAGMKHMMGMKTDEEESEAALQDALAKRKEWLSKQSTIVDKKSSALDVTEAAVSTATSPQTTKNATQDNDANKKEAERQKITQTRTKQLDATNEALKKLTENSEKQIDLTEKQLILMTMTEQEKELAKTALRRDNRFGSQHGYI